jgi:hypothetical protein
MVQEMNKSLAPSHAVLRVALYARVKTPANILGRVPVDAEHGIVAEFHGLPLSAAEQIERMASFVNSYNMKIHGLPVTLGASRLQTHGTELLSHVVGGFFVATAADVATF